MFNEIFSYNRFLDEELQNIPGLLSTETFFVVGGKDFQPPDQSWYIIHPSIAQDRMTYLPREARVIHQSRYGNCAKALGWPATTPVFAYHADSRP